jgi:tRNA dimethylallyltransferase
MPQQDPSPLVVLLGPTGTGKSESAVHLAEALEGEVVNGDSRQIYRGLDHGTAKPSLELRSRAPHHLYDIVEPDETFSAGEFLRRADRVIRQIRARGRLPIMVGGTGLYVRALLEGLFEAGRSDDLLKERLRGLLKRKGRPHLRRMLERVDPATAGRLSPRDTQRTVRALEVSFATGRPFSRHVAEHRPAPRYASVKIGLTLPRPALYRRLDRRVEEMFARGWLEEVRGLLARGHDPSCKAFEALGYREISRLLREGGDFRAVVADIKKKHRRYAKRQETWFRRERDTAWFDASRDGALAAIETHARKALLGAVEA